MLEAKKVNQLLGKIIIKSEIKLVTGTRIGGTASAMSIGGVDSPIIRNPINNKPYLPGSSIKGKLRSLIELRDGEETNKSKASALFGSAQGMNGMPSRIIVRDALMHTEFKMEDFKNSDLPFAECKTEVVIHRITAQATPRQIERVPSGVVFTHEMIINIFENDDIQNNIKMLFDALKLLEDDYLGGGGSRGNGKIEWYIESCELSSSITNISEKSKEINSKIEDIKKRIQTFF